MELPAPQTVMPGRAAFSTAGLLCRALPVLTTTIITWKGKQPLVLLRRRWPTCSYGWLPAGGGCRQEGGAGERRGARWLGGSQGSYIQLVGRASRTFAVCRTAATIEIAETDSICWRHLNLLRTGSTHAIPKTSPRILFAVINTRAGEDRRSPPPTLVFPQSVASIASPSYPHGDILTAHLPTATDLRPTCPARRNWPAPYSEFPCHSACCKWSSREHVANPMRTRPATA